MNGWAKVRDFINGKEIGHIFARKELILLGNLNQLASSSIDMIRNTLVRSGFFKIVDRGRYEFMTKIPSGSTLSELKTLAFKTKLEYLEQVVGRKEREKKHTHK